MADFSQAYFVQSVGRYKKKLNKITQARIFFNLMRFGVGRSVKKKNMHQLGNCHFDENHFDVKHIWPYYVK